jgi:esterase/lipase
MMILRIGLCFLFFSLFSGSVLASETPKWFPAQNAKAIGLVIHGMNLLPSRMDFLSELLSKSGYEVLRIQLKGHGDGLESYKHVSRQIWLSEVAVGVRAVRERAEQLGRPTFFLGFSVGALVYHDFISTQPELALRGNVIFAPALAPRDRNKLVNIFKIFGPGFCLPSLCPEGYRANSCSPLAAYTALFDSVDELKKNHFANLNEPAVVFMDRKDELVSFGDLQSLIAKGPLSRWELVEVSNKDSVLPKSYHHLIIDQDSVGPAMWSVIESRIFAELSKLDH